MWSKTIIIETKQSGKESTMATDNEKKDTKPTLGQYLQSIREDRHMTLRQVEEATEKEISNAYLSQIEQDKIKKPSPNILNTLAEIYGIDYPNLMEMAGYIIPNKGRSADVRHGRVATFAEHNLTPEEEAELLDYLKYIRNRRRGGDKTRRQQP